MSGFRLQPGAVRRLDEIYLYTRSRQGDAQAEDYIRGLFDCFGLIAERRLPWRRIPAELGIDGYYHRTQKHVVYWRVLDDGHIGIVTILHERMHQMAAFRESEP